MAAVEETCFKEGDESVQLPVVQATIEEGVFLKINIWQQRPDFLCFWVLVFRDQSNLQQMQPNHDLT